MDQFFEIIYTENKENKRFKIILNSWFWKKKEKKPKINWKISFMDNWIILISFNLRVYLYSVLSVILQVEYRVLFIDVDQNVVFSTLNAVITIIIVEREILSNINR